MITLDSAKGCTSGPELVERAARVAQFYGFVPFEEAPRGEPSVLGQRSSKFDTKDILFARRDERLLVSAVKTCAINNLGDRRQPTLLWRLMPGERGVATAFELHAIGIPDAIAEGLLIGVTDAIATELGIAKRVVHINSIGSLESSARFTRDLANFLRKYGDDMPPQMRERIHVDPITVALSLADKGHPMLSRAPVSMDYLNEEERHHFWDVLEYLERAETYYELNPLVLGSRDCWSHTLFQMSQVDESAGTCTLFARGGRYDPLCARGTGAGASAVSVSIQLDTTAPQKIKPTPAKPSLYFAHLGKEAKRHAIPALEILRRAQIPVYQSLIHDQIAPQMLDAKRLAVPWILVMGHKEAVEGTMLVRDVRMNAQDTVPLQELSTYLKRRRIGSAA